MSSTKYYPEATRHQRMYPAISVSPQQYRRMWGLRNCGAELISSPLHDISKMKGNVTALPINNMPIQLISFRILISSTGGKIKFETV
jgi:hypothetical protein